MSDSKSKMTLTSVKVKSELFENFKIECVRRKFSFQNLPIVLYFYILQMKNLEKKSLTKIILSYK